MRLRTWPGGRLVVHAPAKVNLFLEVLGKRADGYHELETLMVAVNLYDTLVFEEVTQRGEIEFRSDDAAIPQGPTNLVVRSALLIRDETRSFGRGVKIWLRKRIPAAAGLGGGSSDAAATLAGLNVLWKLGLSLSDLAELGARIGSDVPFFFHTPVAVGRGRGEIVTPLELARPMHLVVVCPQEGCSTAEVFRQLDDVGVRVGNPASADAPAPAASVPPKGGTPSRRSIEPILQCLARGDHARLGELLFNRLEAAATRVCPAIVAAGFAIRAARLAGPLVTGSGSASFGLAADRRAALAAARAIRERFPGRVYVVRSTP
jgi:4-diphosphocytidyl-2-C-methyl-D-erythritol kinase